MATIEASYSASIDVMLIPDDYEVAYSVLHDRANGGNVYEAVGYLGQYYEHAEVNWYFDIQRSGINFNLSTIGGTVTAVDLSLYGQEDYSNTDFNITVVSGADLGDAYVVADYGDLLNDVTSYGSINTSGWALESYNTISLNAAGIAVVQAALGGTLRLGFRSSRDISSTSPKLNGATNYEGVYWYGHTTANKKPKLTITLAFIPQVIFI